MGLVGAFGVRPVELHYCRPDCDGLRIEYQKRNTRGCSPKRTVEALDPVDAPGMGAKLLLELASGQGLSAMVYELPVRAAAVLLNYPPNISEATASSILRLSRLSSVA